MPKNRKYLLTTALAAIMALFTVSATTAATVSVDMPPATFKVSQLGSLTVVLDEGVPEAIVARGQKFKGAGVYINVNYMPDTADVLLTSNLKLLPETEPLKFEHKGTIDFSVDGYVLSLEYEGKATKTKEMEAQTLTKTLSSYGDFVVTKGTGGFADLEGAKGTYTLTFVCESMPQERPKVGKPVEVTFSALGE